MHACDTIYSLSQRPIYGEVEGICRITGRAGKGIPFERWVKETFTDHAYLKPGDIISNEALLCFDESSLEIQQKTGRDKPQRFRTYSHFVADGSWYCLTKADKQRMVALLPTASLVCITDTGQRHILFKHKDGMWQLDEMFVRPDIETFTFLHSSMMALLALGFSQEEIRSGNYSQVRIAKAGVDSWRELETKLRPYRGTQIFTFTSWLMYTIK